MTSFNNSRKEGSSTQAHLICRRQTVSASLAIACSLAAIPQASGIGSYYVNCDGQHVSQEITSVMGEIRANSATPTVPARYHAGVDVADNCVDGAQVRAIEAGRVSTPATPGCLTPFCRRVTSLDGRHAFEYVDIQSSLADGATVQAGDVIGTIADVAEGPHLHLNEIYGLGLVNCENGGTNCYRINPQRQNAMIFVDNDVPAFSAFDVGSVTNEEIILVRFTGIGPEGGQTPTPFTFMNNTFFVNGDVDVLAAVHNVGTEPRKGVYMVHEAPLSAGQPCNALSIAAGPNIAFNTLFDTATSTADILTTFFKQYSDSNGVIATNWKINGNPNQQTQNSSWNTSVFPEGARQICVSATSYPQGTTRSLAQNVVIDRSAPVVTLTDTADVPFADATSSTTIRVVGIETISASGIYTITLSSSGGSQTSTNTAVTSSFTATFSGLAEGRYTAAVVDLGGNSAQAIFRIGVPVKPDGGRLPQIRQTAAFARVKSGGSLGRVSSRIVAPARTSSDSREPLFRNSRSIAVSGLWARGGSLPYRQAGA